MQNTIAKRRGLWGLHLVFHSSHLQFLPSKVPQNILNIPSYVSELTLPTVLQVPFVCVSPVTCYCAFHCSLLIYPIPFIQNFSSRHVPSHYSYGHSGRETYISVIFISFHLHYFHHINDYIFTGIKKTFLFISFCVWLNNIFYKLLLSCFTLSLFSSLMLLSIVDKQMSWN